MQVVTFNLRCDNDYDAENRWQFRKGAQQPELRLQILL